MSAVSGSFSHFGARRTEHTHLVAAEKMRQREPQGAVLRLVRYVQTLSFITN